MNGHVRKRNGKWQGVVYYGSFVENGHRKYLRETFTRPTKKEAEEEYRRRLVLYSDKDSRTPYSEFFEQWIESINIEPTTKESYWSVYNHHLSRIGHKALGKITVSDVKLAIGAADPQKPVGALASRRRYLAVMKSSLGWAVKNGYIQKSPAEHVSVGVPEPDPQAMDPEELMKMVAGCRGQWFYLPVLIAATTGLRKSEVLALRKMDVANGTIVVKRSAYWSSGPHYKETKNKLWRAVPMMDVLQRELDSEWFRDLADDDLLCLRDGEPINPSTLTKSLQAFSGHSFHELRHSHATWLALMGVHPRVVQERLGHQNVAFTMRVYTKVLPSMQDSAVQQLDAAWTHE